MSNLQIFNFQSNSVRTAVDNNGEIWFVAKDIAETLGYTRTSDMLEHCKQCGVLPQLNQINNLAPATKWIPESDAYRATMRSHLPTAEPFQDWLAEDVVPTIRKTGGYQSQSSTPSLPSFKEAIEGVEVDT